MSPSQKGFLLMEGCLEHHHLMSSVLQDSRGTLSWLDLKDAYGSVPHQTLFTIMGLAGLNGLTMEIVRDFYSQTTTAVRTGKDRTDPITIKRGVKQGCPLSPILFNLVMEVLIRAAESTTEVGYKAMQRMLNKVFVASEWAGLTFSPRKCATLSIVRSQRARQKNQLPTMGWARAIDKKVKALVKMSMKLPRRTIDAFLFTPWRSGGLGLPRIADEVHIYGVSTAYRLLSLSQDPTVIDVALSALGATAKKRSQGWTSPQDCIDNPPLPDLAGKQITLAGRTYGPSKRHLTCSAMSLPQLGPHPHGEEEVYEVDVTVPFEGEDSFRATRKAKEDKYNFLKRVRHEKGYRKVQVDGLVVGALGSWDPENEPVLRKLSIGQICYLV
ncbi:hypothetical protein EMCRGX_G005924 [Ephydatia muelleri]